MTEETLPTKLPPEPVIPAIVKQPVGIKVCVIGLQRPKLISRHKLMSVMASGASYTIQAMYQFTFFDLSTENNYGDWVCSISIGVRSSGNSRNIHRVSSSCCSINANSEDGKGGQFRKHVV